MMMHVQSLSEALCNFYLAVIEAPVFSTPLKEVIAEAGNPLELPATLIPFTEPVETVWQKDNKPVDTNAKTSFSDGKCTLKMDSCSLADTGEYAVTVKNSAGTVTSSAKITIKSTFNHFILIYDPPPFVSFIVVRQVLTFMPLSIKRFYPLKFYL